MFGRLWCPLLLEAVFDEFMLVVVPDQAMEYEEEVERGEDLMSGAVAGQFGSFHGMLGWRLY